MIVVSNATPIISLSSVGRLSLLRDLFGEILIGPAVLQEVKAKQSWGYSEVDSDFIRVQPILGVRNRDFLLERLDYGEAETIVLATEVSADAVIIDENLGYRIAKDSGLPVIRTLSVLLKAKEKGLIGSVRPILDEMVAKGRWYSPRVYKDFLRMAGEI